MSKAIDELKDKFYKRPLDYGAFWPLIFPAILDLAARLDEAVKKLNILSDCYEGHLVDFHPAEHSIKKPSPDKQEMFSKQETIEAYAERLVAWYAFPEPDELRQILSDFYEEVKHGT